MKSRTITREELAAKYPDFVPPTPIYRPGVGLPTKPPNCPTCGARMVMFSGGCCSNYSAGYKCPNPDCGKKKED